LATVPDPELPNVSICDLGIVRSVAWADGCWQVVLTPTYSGCPATEVIEQAARDALLQAKLGPVSITRQLAPAWTTDWITDEGRRQLQASGIAPPPRLLQDPAGAGDAGQANGLTAQPIHLHRPAPACPQCGSARTERLSAFGATACKALYRCLACREPFEHFKAL
jgi:ring-1,2-phenylacetyl-CoA epoxidase subunit PaaD